MTQTISRLKTMLKEIVPDEFIERYRVVKSKLATLALKSDPELGRMRAVLFDAAKRNGLPIDPDRYQGQDKDSNWIFVDRVRRNPSAFKLSYWQGHEELKAIREYPEIRDHILDFGCGSGHMDIFLARAGKLVHGVDLSVLAIALANHLLNRETREVRERLTFSMANVTQQGPSHGQVYDSVWSTHVFEHIEDPTEIFQGLRQWVKPGAHMLVVVPLGYAYDDPSHVHQFMGDLQLANYLSSHIEVVRVDASEEDQVLRALCRFPPT